MEEKWYYSALITSNLWNTWRPAHRALYKMYMQVVVDDLQRVTRDKKTQKRWSLLLGRGLVVDIEPIDWLFRWLSWRPMIRWHANFIHAASHLCCQGLGPSLIKPSLLNLLSRIKVRLLASSKRYTGQNRKYRTIESIYALITFDNQNQMVTFVLCMIIKCSDDHFCMITQDQIITFVWSGPDDHLGDGQLNRCRRKTVDLHYSVEAYDRQTAFWCLLNQAYRIDIIDVMLWDWLLLGNLSKTF